MHIQNPESVHSIIVNRVQAEYLVSKGFVILSSKNGKNYFSDTKEIRNAIQRIPFWMNLIKW